MKNPLVLSLRILLGGCVVVDPRDDGNVGRAAERDCLAIPRSRGYRDTSIDSSQPQGDEWVVAVSEHVPGPNPTITRAYNSRSGRTRIVADQGGAQTTSPDAERECLR